MTESADKLVRVRKYLKDHKLEGIVLASRANFAWLSGGGDGHVISQTDAAFGALVVTAKQALVVANNIELERLTSEEPLSAFTAKSFPWTQPMASALQKICTGAAAGYASDDPAATGFAALPGDFVQTVRSPLVEAEVRRYKALGRDCALVIETVARQIDVGASEHQVEADIARHALARGIQPYVVLVASDERIQRYRHPIPTVKHLKKHVMVVLCGMRHGLIACLTRFVHFGPVPPDIQARHEAVCRIETALWNATKPGAAYGDVLKAGIEQYRKEGFAKEWELHHQGGPTGYSGRDIVATPDEKRVVLDHTAVAWNPSITGAKGEDTFILEGDTRTVITASSSSWPTVKAAVPGAGNLLRPGILVR
jgi:Xaa-Pro dipeptidase